MSTQISALIEDQLPGFIVSEYENFSAVLGAYYRQQESVGQPLDIIHNITKYRDIDFYEKNLLKESTTVALTVNASATTLVVADATAFPKRNGYIRVGTEICFYKERTDTEFLDVSRGVSGTTILGDLHNESTFVSTEAVDHYVGEDVHNLSHLFLYAFVRAFEREYLVDFPEAYLKGDVDKRLLIKNIGDFYKTKGGDKSIRFIFNTIVSKSADDIPTTYYPKDHTVKVSESDWSAAFAVQAIILSGDANDLIGKTIIQQADKNSVNSPYASANVENVIQIGRVGDYGLFNLIIDPVSVNGDFAIPQKTVLDRVLGTSLTTGDTVTVDSTMGWSGQEGFIQINGEIIEYEGKTARQFTIKERGTITRIHNVGDIVTSYSNVRSDNVSLLLYGILTKLSPDQVYAYSQKGDKIQISKPGFETRDTIIYDEGSRNVRWKVNTTGAYPSVPLNPGVGLPLQKYLADVGAIYQDDQYYYIATSSYPSTPILTGQDQPNLVDANQLKLIPKTTSTTTEVYKTPFRDIGVFVDGSIAFGYKSEDQIAYGNIQSYTLTSRGSGYSKPPFVLINGEEKIALSTLVGDTVNSVFTRLDKNYTADPLVEIVSGRYGKAEAVVTSGEITSLRLIDAGEYYSAPPVVVITDLAGKGRFAEYRAVVNTQGKITGFNKIDGGKFYTQANVRVELVEEARNNPATATATIYRWVKNRFFNNSNFIDDNGGLAIKDLIENEFYYGVVANPKRLRFRLGDNLTPTQLQETPTLTHSPILGYAYDGNPIYGPYGFSNPLSDQSPITRMNSGYQLKSERTDGPVDAPYDMGTFVDDYEWIATVDTGKTRLDINNGRFCVTPEYPQGTYAYFITIDATNTPVYPYILGENFYSLPVRSNYESKVTQQSIPSASKRLFIPGTLKNGSGEIAFVDAVSTGSVNSVTIEDSQPTFQVGSRIYVDDNGTGGSGASGIVASTFGKSVTSIESRETKATLLTTLSDFYAFENDIITQETTGATGEVIRDISEELTVALRNVTGTFQPGYEINSSTQVINLLLSQNSSYTAGATLALVLFEDPTTEIATGEILTQTVEQNAVRLKVTSGDFNDYLDYAEGEVILKSSDLGNTAGSEIVIINQLSRGINITDVDESVAILSTEENHDFGTGDIVNITVDPDPATTETTYYVTKKKFQEATLIPNEYRAKIDDTGIGKSTVLGLGKDYYAGQYDDVPLVFANSSLSRSDVVAAKASITVESTNFDDSGNIGNILITDAGANYEIDDILTIDPTAIPKVDAADLDTAPTLTMEYMNEAEVNSYLQKRFFVDEADYPGLIAAMPELGAFFQNDAGGTNLIYISKDDDNFAITYFVADTEGEDLTTSDTVFGYTITSVDQYSPPGSIKPQFRFNDENGNENPGYDIRVGSTFTLQPFPGHAVHIVSDIELGLKDDGIAQYTIDYTIASGVTNSGSVTDTITFVPTVAGVYQYVCVTHPEARGTITVYPAPSAAGPLINVDAVGFGTDRTDLNVTNTFAASVGDLVTVGSEIVKITAVDTVNKNISVDRAQEGTTKVNHLNEKEIFSYLPNYRFTPGTRIGAGANSPVVVSYDPSTKKLIVNWDYDATAPVPLTTVSSVVDDSTPEKIVTIGNVSDVREKLLFSLDNNSFLTNPIVDIQKYYFYKFDVSHPSMLNSYLDISTSPNFNVFTEEKEVGLTEPGNPGAFVRIRLGYGANIGEQERKDVNFTSYYYFLTSSTTDTEGSYLRIIDDPLAGRKEVAYTTDTKVVYKLQDVPQYDGTGDIAYTGRSVGKIHSIKLDNLGSGYEKLPTIKGVVPADGYKAVVTAVRDATTNKIISIDIVSPGQQYSKPEVVVSSGLGSGLKAVADLENGSVTQVRVLEPGNYTTTPSIEIIETDNKLFFNSNDIGIPQNISFVANGSGFHTDQTIKSNYYTPDVFILDTFELDAFRPGETIEQRVNGIIVAQGVIAPDGWRIGSNIMRLQDIVGVFKEGQTIIGKSRKKTARIQRISRSSFTTDIVTRERTIGRFTSDRGKVSSNNQRIHDSDFYQDYSYVVRSRTPIKQWRDVVKDTTHPAGFKMFGEIYLDSEGTSDMPSDQKAFKSTMYLVGPPLAVSSLSTKRTIQQQVIKVQDSRVARGEGSVSVSDFDETLTRVRELTLSPAFDGRYDPQTGLKIGNRQFTIIDVVTGSAYTPYNEQEILMTIDGVAQRPGYSFKVVGNQLTFFEAPLGPRVTEDQIVPPQKAYIRAFKFREDTDNARYLKRLKNIADSFDGRTRIFDLNWEDGSVVKTQVNEDLFVYLDGVLQQGSYEIRRFSSPNKTDRIAFDKAPKNYKDLYDADAFPQELQNETYFYGFGVGLYERLGIDKRIIPFTQNNQYLIYDANNNVRNIDNPLYVYVYVDGVLQRQNISYKINGAAITFMQPLEYTEQADGSYTCARVDILRLYGKNYQSTLNLFNYEADVFYNRATVTFDGAGTYDTLSSWYVLNTSDKTTVKQGDRIWGEIISIQSGSGDQFTVALKSQNIDFIAGSDITFDRGDGNPLTITFADYSIAYTTNAAGERILNRVESNYIPFLPTDDAFDSYDYRGEILKEHPSLRRGDKIQIDGELSYRNILSSPIFAKATDYRKGGQASANFFAKVAASDYNGDVLGEGLSVTANIDTGKVISLDWNRRELTYFFNNNILINPTAYNYNSPPVLNFIPTNGEGGGARAQVLVYGGQIIDIILVDGGSGYTAPPRVVVSRGYNIVRENNHPEFSAVRTIFGGQGEGLNATIQTTSSVINLYQRNLLEHIAVLQSPNPLGSGRLVSRGMHLVTPEIGMGFPFEQDIVSRIQYVVATQTPSAVEQPTFVRIFPEAENVGHVDFRADKTRYFSSGVIALDENPVTYPQFYTQGKLGGTVASFMEYLYLDAGYANVSGISLEQLELTYTQFAGISEGVDTWMENMELNNTSITSDGTLFNPGIPSIQELMSYLDAPLTTSSTVVYIPDTTNFPDSGKLLVGKELVTYTSKLSDRLIGVARGVDGTTAEAHSAGQFIRTIGVETTL